MILRFDPPIDNEQTYLDVMRALHQMHPELRWANGNLISPGIPSFVYKMDVGKRLHRKIYHLHIDSGIGRVMRWDDHAGRDAHEFMEITNGWEYLVGGNTTDAFNQLYEQEEEFMMPRVGDYLVYKGSGKSHRMDQEYVRGEKYPIIKIIGRTNPRYVWEYGPIIVIRNEHANFEARFTVEPDNEGLSYKTWFDLMPKGYEDIDFFGQLYEQDEFEWARESLRDRPYIPSPDYNRMTVWVFNKETFDAKKAEDILRALHDLNFDVYSNDAVYFTETLIRYYNDGKDGFYIRTKKGDRLDNGDYKYSRVSVGDSEETFKEVAYYEGFDSPDINTHYVD